MAQKALQLIQDGQVIFSMFPLDDPALLVCLIRKSQPIRIPWTMLSSSVAIPRLTLHPLGGKFYPKNRSTMTRIKHKYWTTSL